MSKEIKPSYLVFLIYFPFGCLIGLFLPDVDQNFKSLLGHRSIITHSILIPFLVNHFFYKDNPKNYLTFFLIGLYVSIAMHLSADLYPKGWKGTALIKLPGNSSIGEGPSIVWMFLNVAAGTYFASKYLINIAYTKKHLITYFIITILISITYMDEDGGDVEAKLTTFLIVFLITFFLARRKSRQKIIEKKKKEKVEKKPQKKKKSRFWIYVIGIPLVLIGLIILGNL